MTNYAGSTLFSCVPASGLHDTSLIPRLTPIHQHNQHAMEDGEHIAGKSHVEQQKGLWNIQARNQNMHTYNICAFLRTTRGVALPSTNMRFRGLIQRSNNYLITSRSPLRLRPSTAQILPATNRPARAPSPLPHHLLVPKSESRRYLLPIDCVHQV